MQLAIKLAVENAEHGKGGPFAALVIKNDELLSTGVNLVTSSNDPTAHAEIVAIRAACQKLGSFQLANCEIYTTCEPCPMCLGAIYWARPRQFYYAATRDAASAAGFDDKFIYDELILPPNQRAISGHCLLADLGRTPFEAWARLAGRVSY